MNPEGWSSFDSAGLLEAAPALRVRPLPPGVDIPLGDHKWRGKEETMRGFAVPSVNSQVLADILSEIADIAAETLDLQEVFGRVASVVRRIIPFDNMGVVRIVDGQHVVLHATTLPGHPTGRCTDPMPLTAWSPRWRPHPGPNRRINDGQAELDPAYPMDAQAMEFLGSGLWEPFRCGNAFVGGVWLCSESKHAFGDEHQSALRPIAALLGSAVEHWQIWDTEHRRHARLDKVEALLGTLATSLDVRDVFPRLSAEMQTILAHDLMVLTELDARARTIRVIAFAGECDAPARTDVLSLIEQEIEGRNSAGIKDDIQAELVPVTESHRLILSSGLRSWLHVPVCLSGEVNGRLCFLHRDAARYDRQDAEVAQRIADRISLTLSMQKLAEEARIAVEARERAERLEAKVETLARELGASERRRVIGVSPSWKETLLQVGRVGPSETTVLITGESGTGKEVITSLVHQSSPRARKPLVAMNCAALPEQLLESELFGHEKGAFTGAIATKIGRIEQAEGGTLFLDEVAEMSPHVQAKFLRVLEAREFQRLGGTRTLPADIRVIAATNRDLLASIDRRTFREDLYYRLNVFTIHILALRERPADILPLAEAFVEDLGRSMGRPAAGISREARDWILAYSWPGNVRELRNAMERAILLCDGGLITHAHLPSPMVPANGAGLSRPNIKSPDNALLAPEGVDISHVERDLIRRALGQAAGNKSKAARLLGLSRAQLYTRLEKYAIE